MQQLGYAELGMAGDANGEAEVSEVVHGSRDCAERTDIQKLSCHTHLCQWRQGSALAAWAMAIV